jgi:hypothetical protein
VDVAVKNNHYELTLFEDTQSVRITPLDFVIGILGPNTEFKGSVG